MARNGCSQSGYRTLKLAVSPEWIDEMNWFFARWHKFRKGKNLFQYFLDGPGQNWVQSFSSWDPKISWRNLWIKQTFFMLTVMQQLFVRPTLYSIFLTFKCQFIAVLFARSLAVARRIPWNRICPSLLPDIWGFLGSG